MNRRMEGKFIVTYRTIKQTFRQAGEWVGIWLGYIKVHSIACEWDEPLGIPVSSPQENIAHFLSMFGDIVGQATDEICESLDITLSDITELEVAWKLHSDRTYMSTWWVMGCDMVVKLDGLGAVLSCHEVNSGEREGQ